MNEKLSLQNIADALAQKAGVSKRVADTFSKAFFDAIVEALAAGEESIKVKGLGTFKLVAVESRESVNVTNGERFIIPGYKKVAFTPEESVVSVLNQRDDVEAPANVKESESVEESAKVKVNESVEEEASIETLIAVPEPTHVEMPQDAFAGIDMLISTPESVEEVRQQYEEAKVKMEQAVMEARKANAEKLRLEKLLERLEKNMEPENDEEEVLAPDDEEVENAVPIVENGVEEQDEAPAEESAATIEAVAPVTVSKPVSRPAPMTPEEMAEEEKRKEAFMRVMGEKPRLVEADLSEEKTNHKKIWMVTLIALFLAIIAFFIYRTFVNIEAVKDVPKVEQPSKPSVPKKVTPSAPKKVKDSHDKPLKADSVKTAEARKDSVKKEEKPVETPKPDVLKEKKEAKPSRPTTHVMQRGESLTRISQKYYGTKDSVRALIRVNTFKDPDNVPVGAVVKLP